jgi:hypothetical protein
MLPPHVVFVFLRHQAMNCCKSSVHALFVAPITESSNSHLISLFSGAKVGVTLFASGYFFFQPSRTKYFTENHPCALK